MGKDIDEPDSLIKAQETLSTSVDAGVSLDPKATTDLPKLTHQTLLETLEAPPTSININDCLDLKVGNQEIQEAIQILSEFHDAHKDENLTSPENFCALIQQINEKLHVTPQDLDPEQTSSQIPEDILSTARECAINPSQSWDNTRAIIFHAFNQMHDSGAHFFGRVPNLILQVPYLDLVAQCPRTGSPKNERDEMTDRSGFHVDLRRNPLESTIIIQNTFLEESKRIAGITDPEEHERQRRKIYILAQTAIEIGNFTEFSMGYFLDKPNTEPMEDLLSVVFDPRLSLANDMDSIFFPEQLEAETAERYISTIVMKLIIKSENGDISVIQEDFITAGLKRLTRKFGLVQKYKKLFESLETLKKSQYKLQDHFCESKPEEDRAITDNISLLTVLNEFYGKNGRKPVVGVLGSGDQFTEAIMRKFGLTEKIFGVDVSHKKPAETVETTGYPDGGANTIVGLKNMVERKSRHIGPRELPKVPRTLLEHLPGTYDVIIITDVLHEIPGNIFDYLKHIIDQKLNPGGTLYISDPIFSEVLDKLTDESLYRLDNAINLMSMTSLEDLLDVAAYAEAKGLRLKSFNVSKSLGHNDALRRAIMVIEKPKEDNNGGTSLYHRPKLRDPDRRLPENDRDMLLCDFCEIFPLNLIFPPLPKGLQITSEKKEDDRKRLVNYLLENEIFTKFLKLDLLKRSALQVIARALYRDQEDFDRELTKRSPVPNAREIMDITGDIDLLRDNNHIGLIYFVVELLEKRLGIRIDLPQTEWPIHYSRQKISPEIS